MELSTTREIPSFLDTRYLPSSLRNQKVQYRIHKSSPPVCLQFVVQSVSGQSRGGLITIPYCLVWDYWVPFPSPLATRRLRWKYSNSSQPGGSGSRIYIPQEQGGPVIPLGTGFSFRRLLRLAGITVKVFYPASTRGCMCWIRLVEVHNH
jgi:hypothetical protein